MPTENVIGTGKSLSEGEARQRARDRETHNNNTESSTENLGRCRGRFSQRRGVSGRIGERKGLVGVGIGRLQQ